MHFLLHQWCSWWLFSCANELEDSAQGLAGSQPWCACQVYTLGSLSQVLLSPTESAFNLEQWASIVQLYCIQGPTPLLRRVNIIYMFLNGGGKWRIWGKPTKRGRIFKRHTPDSTLSQLVFDDREKDNHCATLLLYRHRLAVSPLLLEALSIQCSEETLHSSSTTCLAV